MHVAQVETRDDKQSHEDPHASGSLLKLLKEVRSHKAHLQAGNCAATDSYVVTIPKAWPSLQAAVTMKRYKAGRQFKALNSKQMQSIAQDELKAAQVGLTSMTLQTCL